jgi:hypothetical protein
VFGVAPAGVVAAAVGVRNEGDAHGPRAPGGVVRQEARRVTGRVGGGGA